MSIISAPIQAVWRSAEMLIAFHKDKDRKKRASPYFWRPKEAFARLQSNPDDQEAVVVMRGAGDNDDVQIKMHTDKIVIRRDNEREIGWSGVILDDLQIRVMVNGTLIRIDPDGGVMVEKDAAKTHLEGSGAIFRFTPDTEIMVSADGGRMSRKTDDQFCGFTPDGVVSRRT